MLALCLHEIGGDLQVDEVPKPVPGEGEVVVDIAYAAVNPLDVWVTRGNVGGAADHLPWVPGTEATGHLDGRPVLVRGAGLGVMRPGLIRQRAAVPAGAVQPVPEGLDLAQVAGAGVAGVTAWHAIHTKARVAASDRVLVLGASGGVGTAAVQLARACGATVWGQTGSAAKADGIGADRTVVADETSLVAAVAELRPTVVLDPLGGAYTDVAVQALEPGGRLVIYGTSSDEVGTLNLRMLYRKGITVLGYAGLLSNAQEQQTALEAVFGALRDGTLRLPIELVPLAAAADVHRRILDRRVTGKLIVDCRGAT